jgi:hypothetical protein
MEDKMSPFRCYFGFLLKSLLGLSILFILQSCVASTKYLDIPKPDREMNLLGLQALSKKYLDEHPQDFDKFSRILTEANDALETDQTRTHGQVMGWIQKTMTREGYNEHMPVYMVLRRVYLKNWEGAYLTLVDKGEHEYLYDLLSAVMGGMHLCSTCSTGHMKE